MIIIRQQRIFATLSSGDMESLEVLAEKYKKEVGEDVWKKMSAKERRALINNSEIQEIAKNRSRNNSVARSVFQEGNGYGKFGKKYKNAKKSGFEGSLEEFARKNKSIQGANDFLRDLEKRGKAKEAELLGQYKHNWNNGKIRTSNFDSSKLVAATPKTPWYRTRAGKAGLIGGGVAGLGALGYGAYRATHRDMD